MKRPSIHLIQAFWCGTALASLFLYPLAMALADGRFYLLWQSQDNLELVVAFAGLAAVLSSAWAALDRLPRGSLQGAARLALIALPIASFAEWLMRQQPIAIWGVLLAGATAARLIQFASAAGALIMAIAAIVFFPAIVARLLELGVLALSPVALIFVFDLCLVTRAVWPAVEAADQNLVGATPVSASNRSSIFVFLFDELSYRFLYSNGSVRTDLPNFRAFSDSATNYHSALSPSDNTLSSMAGMLVGHPLANAQVIGEREFEVDDRERTALDFTTSEALFTVARAQGLRTELFGNFFDYCRLFAPTLDVCHSFSLLNSSTVMTRFSPFAPIMTTLNLWPHKFPYAVLSNKTLAWQQRRMVEGTTALALGDLSPNQPRFRLVHYSIPHIPFVFDRDGYHVPDNPMLQNAANYKQQLQYVDTLVGTLVSGLRESGVLDRTTIVILSDHEYRALVEPAERRHVPLMIRRPEQSERADESAPVRTEQVLRSLLGPS